MPLEDALRILRFRDQFPDIDRALAMVGFVRLHDAGPLDAAAPSTPAPPPTGDEEDEPVWSEALDGWMVLPDDPGLGDPNAPFQADADVPPAVDLAGDTVFAPSAAWGEGEDQEHGTAGSSPGPPIQLRERPRIGDTRPAPARIIAHVIEPTSSTPAAGARINYRRVREAKIARHPQERPPRHPDEPTWRLAAECLTSSAGAPSRQVIDLAACVDILAQVRPIERLPLRPHGARRATQTLLRDIALANGPYGGDVEGLINALRAHRRGSDLQVLGFRGDLDQLGCGAGPVWTWQPLDVTALPAGTVIVVTYVEAHEVGQIERWLAFARSVVAERHDFVFVDVGGDLPRHRDDWPGTWHELER